MQQGPSLRRTLPGRLKSRPSESRCFETTWPYSDQVRFDPYAADTTAHGRIAALAPLLQGCGFGPGIQALVGLRVSQICGRAFCLRLHARTDRRSGVSQET